MIKTDINCYLLPCRISLYESNLARGITVCRYGFYADIYRGNKMQLQKQGMRQHGCSGCMNPQIFGTSPFAPADFEAQSSLLQNKDCTRRSKYLTHALRSKVSSHFYHILVNMITCFTHMNSVVAFSWFSKKCPCKTLFNTQWPLLPPEKLPSSAAQAKQH